MSVLTNVELVFWNLDRGDPPTVEKVRNELLGAHLNPERAADIADSTAFRRAVDAVRDKTTVARCFTRKADQVLCAQIDHEEEQDGEIKRSRLGIFSLQEGVIRSEDFSDGSTGALVRLREAQGSALRTYTWADVSKIIQTILVEDGLGAYSPRRNGGVYFVPIKPDAPELLARIDQFSSAVNIRFLRYQVPDLGAQRDEIADAIVASLTTDLNMHQEAIAGYHQDTKPGIVSNRREGVAATARLMEQLQTLLGPANYTALGQRVNQLNGFLAEVDKTIEEAKHRAKIAGPSRRIAGIAHTLWEGAQSHAV